MITNHRSKCRRHDRFCKAGF